MLYWLNGGYLFPQLIWLVNRAKVRMSDFTICRWITFQKKSYKDDSCSTRKSIPSHFAFTWRRSLIPPYKMHMIYLAWLPQFRFYENKRVDMYGDNRKPITWRYVKHWLPQCTLQALPCLPWYNRFCRYRVRMDSILAASYIHNRVLDNNCERKRGIPSRYLWNETKYSMYIYFTCLSRAAPKSNVGRWLRKVVCTLYGVLHNEPLNILSPSKHYYLPEAIKNLMFACWG